MPYKSEAQRKFMHAKHPKIARRWDEEKKPVEKSVMTDRELKARKKTQAATWRTTGALGVTGAALGTAGIVATKKPGALKPINAGLKRAGAKKEVTGQGLTNAGIYTGLLGGGIGGAGSFNSAKISADEAKRRKMVRKNYGPMDDGFFGEIGKAANFNDQLTTHQG